MWPCVFVLLVWISGYLITIIFSGARKVRRVNWGGKNSVTLWLRIFVVKVKNEEERRERKEIMYFILKLKQAGAPGITNRNTLSDKELSQ
jgi:hypothetical protein